MSLMNYISNRLKGKTELMYGVQNSRLRYSEKIDLTYPAFVAHVLAGVINENKNMTSCTYKRILLLDENVNNQQQLS